MEMEKKKVSSKFFIEDNMCTPYKLILSRANRFLIENGWENANSPEEADLHIVGGCAAFHSLENEALELIKSAKKAKKAEIIAFGCLPTISPEKVKPLNPDRIIHARSWERLETLVKNPKVLLNEVPDAHEFRSDEEYRVDDPGRAFILVETGCSSNCPFCPHKIGIGNLKSRPMPEVIKQVKYLMESNKKIHTICLHGNDTGSYGTDIGTTFPELVRQVLKIVPRLHLTQVNADWAYKYRDELFPLLQKEEKIKEFQVLIQSSSPRILDLMERCNKVKELYPYLKNLRKTRPDLILRTDLMLGYPTATMEEDKESLDFVSKLFDEVAIHGFEQFTHARIMRMGLPFHSQEEISKRIEYAKNFMKSFPAILAHHGGQVYHTMEGIEGPKVQMRKDRDNLLEAANI